MYKLRGTHVRKAIAYLTASALLIFIGLILLGAYSGNENAWNRSQTQFKSASTECPDLRPLLDQLLTASIKQPALEFEE